MRFQAFRRWKVIGLVATGSLLLASSVASSEDLQRIGTPQISGDLEAAMQISAIAFSDDREFVLLAADERGSVQILQRSSGQTTYALIKKLLVPLPTEDDDAEADIEAMAINGPWLYIAGSQRTDRLRSKRQASSSAANCVGRQATRWNSQYVDPLTL